MTTPTAVVTLDELAADPAKAEDLSRQTLRVVAMKALGVLGECVMIMLESSSASPSVVEDRVLTPTEAAAIVGVKARTMVKRRHAKPYRDWLAPSPTRHVRFSSRKIAEYLAQSGSVAVHVPGERSRRKRLTALAGSASPSARA